MPDTAHAEETNRLIYQLRQFLSTILKWRPFTNSGPQGPGIPILNMDGNEHALDRDAATLVSKLNFKNRSGNTGILYVGVQGATKAGVAGSIKLAPGESVSPPWTYPNQWYYTVVGSAATDVYEAWWSG